MREVDVLQVKDGLAEAAVLPVDVDVEDQESEGPLRNADDRNLQRTGFDGFSKGQF